MDIHTTLDILLCPSKLHRIFAASERLASTSSLAVLALALLFWQVFDMSRYAAKKDANHAQIQDVFMRLLGGKVTDISRTGMGLGDLLVSFGKFCALVEIGVDEKHDDTYAEIAFNKRHPGVKLYCWNVEQAAKLAAYVRKQSEKLT